VAVAVITTATSSAISIVWDREFAFQREMLVAPVSRISLVAGRALGGASIATVQGTIMLALAPLIGVHLTGLVVIEVIGSRCSWPWPSPHSGCSPALACCG
jgi:ABC-2 type transport system permease protein